MTGAGAETGRAIALRLAAEGALVVVADIDARSPASGPPTIEAGRPRGGDRARLHARRDVRRRSRSPAATAAARTCWSTTPAAGARANYLEATPEQWSATLDLNLRAAMLATQLALEPMRAAGGGVVVNIASTAGIATDRLRVARVRRRQGRPDPLHDVARRPARAHERARELRRARLDRSPTAPSGELARMTAAERGRRPGRSRWPTSPPRWSPSPATTRSRAVCSLLRGGRPRRFLP